MSYFAFEMKGDVYRARVLPPYLEARRVGLAQTITHSIPLASVFR